MNANQKGRSVSASNPNSSPKISPIAGAYPGAALTLSNLALMVAGFERGENSTRDAAAEVVLAQCASVLRLVSDLETMTARAEPSLAACRMTSGAELGDALALVADVVDMVRVVSYEGGSDAS